MAEPTTGARDRRKVLLVRARERLARLGMEPPAGSFVCPMCLRLRPESAATRSHFPADALPGGRAQTELAFRDCNGATATYERSAIDYLTNVWDVSIGPTRGRRIKGRGVVRTDGHGVGIQLVGPTAALAGRKFNAARSGAPDPHHVTITIREPLEDGTKRSLVAWSFLSWFFYAGYRYVMTPGAALVRRSILDPSQPLPAAIVLRRGPLQVPLPQAEPVLVVEGERPVKSAADIHEVIGLGARWGTLVVALPLANDAEGRVWLRLGELVALDGGATVAAFDLRRLVPGVTRDGLHDAMVIENKSTGSRWEVSHEPTRDELQSLVEGRSPHVITPQRARSSPRPTRGSQ